MLPPLAHQCLSRLTSSAEEVRLQTFTPPQQMLGSSEPHPTTRPLQLADLRQPELFRLYIFYTDTRQQLAWRPSLEAQKHERREVRTRCLLQRTGCAGCAGLRFCFQKRKRPLLPDPLPLTEVMEGSKKEALLTSEPYIPSLARRSTVMQPWP